MTRMMIMAGGTGGHVFPALAVANELSARKIEISWIGTRDGLEARVVPEAGYELDTIQIKGLRKSGVARKLLLPFMMLKAMAQVLSAILRRRPGVVLGMGGFVSGPGGLVAAALRLPLVLHEQNSVAGMTNSWLSRVSTTTLSGFREVEGLSKYKWTGNPVRAEISAIPGPQERIADRSGPLRLLVVGGSQGAAVLNETLPDLLSSYSGSEIEIWHQCGRGRSDEVSSAYKDNGQTARVADFIEDMASAYEWSDVVICRSGAMTVSEICVAGAVAIFVPYPHAVSDHQARNAESLVSEDAAFMVRQEEFVHGKWLDILGSLAADREQLVLMASRARSLGKPDATMEVADICMEAAGA